MTLDDINKMLTEREQARVERDYGKADGIRDELRQKAGINIDDRARIFTTQDGKVHPRPDARGNFSEPPPRRDYGAPTRWHLCRRRPPELCTMELTNRAAAPCRRRRVRRRRLRRRWRVRRWRIRRRRVRRRWLRRRRLWRRRWLRRRRRL